MIWFKHDSSAMNDAKIKKLIIKYGAEGYAIYFHCIELITGDINENNITFELEHDSEIIADNLKIKGTADQSGIERVEEIMKYIIELKLFEEKNNHIFCFKLLKRLDTSMTSNAKMRKMITEAKQHHDSIMTESCKKRIEENRRDKKRTEKKRAKFVPPTLQEIEEYILLKNLNVDSLKFFDYFQVSNWVDSKGNKVKNWKQKLLTWSNYNKTDIKETKKTNDELTIMSQDNYDILLNTKVGK